MLIPTFKTAAITVMGLSLTAGTAFAGNGKDCGEKTTAMKSQSTAATPATAVLAASEHKKTKIKKSYSFDEAVKMCQSKGAADLQACIDYKTGKTTPKS